MKSKVVHLSIAAAAVSLLLAACGGGGGSGTGSGGVVGGGGGSSAPALQVSGTAATGAALAGANVQVKCGTGSGSATTTNSGSYTVSMTGGALPCIVQVTGTTADGTSITLHSVVETGTASGGNTAAVANVTPVTEMIVARLMAALPSDAFASFNAQQVTQTAVTAATTAIVDALKAAGVDLGSIDPLKATLVPATSTTAGNAYDQQLDALGEQVPPEALPQVVNQIATAAASDSSTGLTEAMTAVAGGALEGCPKVISGRYRTLDLFGKSVVRDIDFAKKTFSATNGTDQLTIATDATKPCEFTVTGTTEGKAVEWNIVMGANGSGAYKARSTNPANTGTNGYIFPVQARTLADLAGSWTFLQSGFDPNPQETGLVQWPGKIEVSNGAATVCDYDTSTWQACVDPTAMSLVARSDGGFDLVEGGTVGGQLYGYKAPNGAMVVFGTTNAAGVADSVTQQTSLVATKLATLPLPTVGTETKFWDVSVSQPGNLGTRVVAAPFAETNTVLSVDTAAGTAMRKRVSDGREDTVRFNQPLAGLRVREGGTWNGQPFAEVIQIPLGIGITLSVNSDPHRFDGTGAAFIQNISVLRP